MLGVNDLVGLVFRGLSPLVIEDVVDEGEGIAVRARTPAGPGACPGCGAESVRVHGYAERGVVCGLTTWLTLCPLEFLDKITLAVIFSAPCPRVVEGRGWPLIVTGWSSIGTERCRRCWPGSR